MNSHLDSNPHSASPPPASGRVLPTLNEDGTRRWIRPKLYSGRYHRARVWVAWGLILLFALVPFIRVGGKPIVLLDIPRREFHLFGATFLPTDGVLLMLLLLSAFVAIFLITALLGRVWCGWACPQTVYMEFLFRPIERWLEGSPGQQRKLDREGPNARRILKFGIYALLAVFVANVFLAYFVGVDRLRLWVTQSPFEHPTPFIVVAFTSALVFFDFAYFREQMCTVICPYARLQSVMLDKRSLIVGYDESRGEPRGRGRNTGGDCIDCKACVIACPTGIDIRNGLQLECIACAQCVDACDGVMTKLKKPTGLIRYASQRWFESKRSGSLIRPRVVIYPVVLVLLLSGLLFFGSGRQTAEVTVLRGIGEPFAVQQNEAGSTLVRNQLRIKIRNRGEQAALYHLSLPELTEGEFIAPENPVPVEAGKQVTVGAFVLLPKNAFSNGERRIELLITDDAEFSQRTPYKLLGPMSSK